MILVCVRCNAKNRVPEDKLSQNPQCGQCHTALIPQSPIILDETNFSTFIQYHDLPIVIDLWADWCGPCKMMAPHFEQVSSQYNRVAFAKIDTEKNPRLSQAFNIKSLPTIVMMDKTKELARISGALRGPQLKGWIDQQIVKVGK